MPNIKSQEKRMRTSEKQRARNRAVKSTLKTKIRKYEEVSLAGDEEAAREAFDDASRALDKAVSKGVIHKNKAANKKSRMSRGLKSAD